MNRSFVRILIVDDHPVVRSGLCRYIEHEPGLEVCGDVANGQSAVRTAAELRPDIVLLDISMHETNGLDTLRLMTRDCPDAAVIIFSMHESETMIRDLIVAGARGYVLKTDPAEIVITSIRTVSEGRPYFSPAIADTILETYLHLVKGDAPVGASGDVLTPRERQILQQLAKGTTNKEMARTLGISIKTVETHRATIMRKLGARSVVDVVRYAIRNNLSLP